jgi:CheY-like chemotaxis protein
MATGRTPSLRLAGDPEADDLLSRDPLALVIGMVLDQQVPLERAFTAPAVLAQRLGRELDAAAIAGMDPDRLAELFSRPPALHRYPTSMAARVQALCKVIAEEHGGSIGFSNLEKGGASFRLFLPRSAPEDLAALKPAAGEMEILPPVPGRRVLVVEDETDIAQIIARFLRDEGDVADVVDPPEALGIAIERPYDLIISDFEMEKTKGPDLYAALIERDPGWASKFLFITGDILNPHVLEFLRKTEAACLAKPFDLEDLKRTVRRMLSQRRR